MKSGSNGGGGSLYELLSETGLLAYYTAFKNKLKIDNPDHLKFIAESDLSEIGMSKPEQRRLLKNLQKRYPNSMFGKLKKKVFDKVHTSSSQQSTDGVVEMPARSEQHIIPSSRILLCQMLGGGEFGQVWQGVWSGNSAAPERIQVAVKCIPPEKMAANPLNFLQEAAIMHRIDHENVVLMFGVVLEPKTIMLVTELAPLRSLLECLKQTSSKISFPVLRLCDYAEQICCGMAYLESNRLIHRDLAARNILVFSIDRVKISDFGLSRALGAGEDYYRGNFGASLKLPIAWCASECIKFLKFTSASDVWAFGVTLWEMFTYGFQPWLGMTGRQILEAVDKPNAHRLDMPDDCPLEFYNLMLQTWEHEPGNRPKFADILTVLPEIRPEQVRAVVECADGQVDHLQYKNNELITVLNKRPREYPDGYYWKGVVSSGRTGLFSPSNTVAYLSLDFFNKNSTNDDAMTASFSSMSVNSDRSVSSGRSFGGVAASLRSSLTNAGRYHANLKSKLSRRMISGPQNDLRHTGHVGLDGSSFGDVEFVDKSHLPLQVVTPFQQQKSEQVATCCFARSSTVTSSDSVSSPTESFGGRLLSTASETAALIPPDRSYSGMSVESGVDLDAAVFDPRSAGSIGGGCSLFDDVFNELHKLESNSRKNDGGGVQNFAADISEPSSPVDSAVDHSEGAHLIDPAPQHRRVVNYSSTAKSVKQKAAVKPISSSDAKMLSDLTSLATKISDKTLTRDLTRMEKLAHPIDEQQQPPPTSASNLKLKLNKLKMSPPSEERKAFCDSLPRGSASSMIRISPEAENAYKTLIEAKSNTPTLIPRSPLDEHDEDDGWKEDNPLRLLKADGAAVVRRFRAGGGSMSRKIVEPPPVAPKISTTGDQPPPIPPKSFKLANGNKTSPTPEKINRTPEKNNRSSAPKSSPPPVPPKPKLRATAAATTTEEESGGDSTTRVDATKTIQYAVLRNSTETNGGGGGRREGQDDEECPSMSTLESVDKYQLLNFVLSPLRASNEHQRNVVVESRSAAAI